MALQDDASAKDLLAHSRAIVDGVMPPVVFVTANAVGGLQAAATTALGLSAAVVVLRLARRHRLTYALGGLGGVTVAVGAALWVGTAEGYFGPGMLLNAGYALAAVVSILVRRPLVALAAWALYRGPLDGYFHPRVRRAFSEITWAWAALFAARAVIRYVLIVQGRPGLLAATSVVTGVPAFLVLVTATYTYVNWRLRRLGVERPGNVRPAQS